MSPVTRSTHSAREHLAGNVRRLRLERGWSQMRLAVLTDMHINTVGALERGQLNASIDVVERIALAFEVPFGSLFEASAPQP